MTSPRALSLLAALAAPIFLAAAVAGWLSGLWPATPVTFAVAALVVTGGPLLAIFHVATAERDAEPAPAPVVRPAPVRAPAPEPLVLTPKAAAARAFMGWRDT